MRCTLIVILAVGGLSIILANHQSAFGQRGGFQPRPAPRPVATSGVTRGAVASGPFGTSTAVSSRGTVVGPSGASVNRGTSVRTVTTPGGATVRAGTVGVGATGPGGVSAGRAAGGVQVTGPGGNQVTRVGTAQGVSVPRGPTVVSGGRSGAAVGPGGVAVGSTRGTAVIGPGGGVAVGGSRNTAVVGPGGGVAVGSTRGAAVIGPGGGVAVGGTRTGVAVARPSVVRPSTVYMGINTLPAYGNQVRAGFVHRTVFTPTWHSTHPAVWATAGWAVGRAYAVPQFTTVSTFVGLPTQQVAYDYGSNVVYTDGSVFVDGDRVASDEEYYSQAEQLASDGRQAKADEKEEWQPLGVFALVRGDEETSDKIFQLAVNKAGVIRGNFYDALTDTLLPVFGQVNKKTQRVAWTVGEKKTVVYEAGCENLTRDETPVLVHFGKDKTQQYVLVRIPQPEE